MDIEVSRCLDLRYKSKDSTYPVCIRLYHHRKYDYVKTGVFLTRTEYEDLYSPKIKPQLKDALKRISNTELLINKYLQNSVSYNIKGLRTYIKEMSEPENIQQEEVQVASNNIFDWFDIKIKLCNKNKQIGSAESYASTKHVYQEVLSAHVLPFQFFTVEKLKEIETNLLEQRLIAISTVGKHARNLRAIFKLALNENIISTKEYPFGRYRYVIPEVTKAKKSLTRKMMADLVNYQPRNNYEKRAIGYFLFSYYGNGMNLKDMALLRFKDMQNGILSFYRKKTKNTASRLKTIRVVITEEMLQIIKDFGNSCASAEDYIFPIVSRGMSDKEVSTKVKTRNKSVNKTLSRISKHLGFGKKVTLGMARHSSANALKQEGVSLNFIQEFLGHGSATITEHYLNSFEDNIAVRHVEKLKDYFKKNTN